MSLTVARTFHTVWKVLDCSVDITILLKFMAAEELRRAMDELGKHIQVYL